MDPVAGDFDAILSRGFGIDTGLRPEARGWRETPSSLRDGECSNTILWIYTFVRHVIGLYGLRCQWVITITNVECKPYEWYWLSFSSASSYTHNNNNDNQIVATHSRRPRKTLVRGRRFFPGAQGRNEEKKKRSRSPGRFICVFDFFFFSILLFYLFTVRAALVVSAQQNRSCASRVRMGDVLPSITTEDRTGIDCRTTRRTPLLSATVPQRTVNVCPAVRYECNYPSRVVYKFNEEIRRRSTFSFSFFKRALLVVF